MGSLHAGARGAFATPEWRSSADAFFQARGLSLFVMDLSTRETLFAGDRCGYCHLSMDTFVPGPTECYDRPPSPCATVCQHACRAGLATFLAPIVYEGSLLGHAVVSGFVSSTRERRRLYEHLIGRGIREEVARLAVRGMPVVTRREIEAFAVLGASLARAAVVASPVGATDANAASPKGSPTNQNAEHDVEALDAVCEAMTLLGDPAAIAGRLLLSAVGIFGAEAGTIALRRNTGCVEVVASAGDGVRGAGTMLRLEGGAAARTLESGRTVVVTGVGNSDDGVRRCTVVAPLVAGEAPTGTLELRLAPGRRPSTSAARRIEGFARFAALAIAHSERDQQPVEAFEPPPATEEGVGRHGVAALGAER